MASNYEVIRADNIREYGEGTRHLSFLGRLYTYRTHFIFELLQNAEDAGASKIRFDLFEDRLEVRHDGRPFNERDVRGICGVDEGTKAEDLTQIGKFGIGFKSVYAYTGNPEIHSGDEHFRIEHYVRPFQASSVTPGNTWTTLFIFPFDVSDVEPTTCRHEIAERLRNLNARTLLFLRNMGEIAYKLPDQSGGTYLREVTQRGIAKQILVIGQNNGLEEEDEIWLVFERPVPVPSDDGQVCVEVAFRLQNSTHDQAEEVVKVDDSPLIVYFPTEKPTRLGFLVQGPYRTTPSRDNIPKDDNWNAELLRETAILITEALGHLKGMGLMTISLLQALPIRTGDFPKDGMFYPVAEQIQAALRNQDLLPSDDGSFVSARNARLARTSDLRTLLTHGQLRGLFQTADQLKWLSGDITQDRTPELRSFLMNELDVAEIDPEAFARRLSVGFLESMNDAWFARFYEFLLDKEALWGKSKRAGERPVLRTKPILRLEDGSLVVPFDDLGNPTAYLPVIGAERFARVRQSIAQHRPALEFLKRLGLGEPDAIANVVETILPKYRSAQRERIDEAEYRGDLEAVLGALKTDSQQKKQRLIEEARKTPFVQAINAVTTRTTYRKPDEVYLRTADLCVFFEGNSDIWFLSGSTEAPDDVWKELGAADLPRRMVQDRIPSEVRERSNWDPEVSNYDLDGLRFFLNRLKQYPDRSELALQQGATLWRILLCCLQENASFFDGTYRWFYHKWKTKTFAPDFLVLLRGSTWLPTSLGERRAPSECSLDELPPDLEQDDRLIEALDVQPDRSKLVQKGRTKLLEELRSNGYNEDLLETLDWLREHPQEAARLKRQRESWQSHQQLSRVPKFPTGQSKNPSNRETQIKQQYTESPGREFDIRNRSVRTSKASVDSQVSLRSLYTNDDQQLVCQICKDEMPFKKRDGEYYFEAVEALNGDHFSKEHEAQYLALCPVCAAMYTEFVKRDPIAMEQVANALLASQEPEIPLELGDLKTSIRFVDIHFRDLKTILMLNGGGGITGQVAADETARWES